MTCGRFTMANDLEMHNALVTKVHFTFTWKQEDDDLKLIHANATHVKDIAEIPQNEPPKPITQSIIFDYQNTITTKDRKQKKLAFRDMDGATHYLYPEEIIFIHTKFKICHIYTKEQIFCSRMNLSDIKHPQLIQVHRSYIVNQRYIKSIKRYEAKLIDHICVPIGRERYLDIKKALQ